ELVHQRIGRNRAARAVEQRVELAVARHGRLDGGAHVLLARDIGADEERLAALRLRRLHRLAAERLVDLADHDLRAFAREGDRSCAADAVAAAADEGDSSFHPFHAPTIPPMARQTAW